MLPKTDSQIRNIEEPLERRAEREARQIGVAVDGHTVTLSGRVQSWGEKNAVASVVRNAQGVSTVNNQLLVDSVS